MKPPSVEKEFSVRILPSLAVSGFKRAGGKRFARWSPDVIQFLFLHVRSGLRREFMLEYCALLAFEPHQHPSLAHGGPFPVGSRSFVWQRADSEENLGRSMLKVAEQLPDLLQWFDRTSGLAGFMASYETRLQTELPALRGNGHASFTLACGAAAAGDLSLAAARLRQAATEFRAELKTFAAEYPSAAGSHWAHERLQRCDEFAAAIQDGMVPTLFENWRGTSFVALKLSP